MRLTSPVGEVDYKERVSSRRTDAVWVGLTIIFLERPRVVLALKERRGSVWDIAFSTRQPEEVVGAVSGRIGENT